MRGEVPVEKKGCTGSACFQWIMNRSRLSVGCWSDESHCLVETAPSDRRHFDIAEVSAFPAHGLHRHRMNSVYQAMKWQRSRSTTMQAGPARRSNGPSVGAQGLLAGSC